jgi:hemolysin activation/secretion protein
VAGAVRGYKSLDLPGFAHHVAAARLAGALESGREPSTFDVGGTGGASIELVPGYSIGDRARTFFVRGFPPGAQRGTRAVGASVEYRAPLALPARGYRLLPVFLSRTSVTAFADAAQAWCSVALTAARSCTGPSGPSQGIASVGAELNVDATLLYDTLYRFRFGIARPVVQPALADGALSAYFTVGLAF